MKFTHLLLALCLTPLVGCDDDGSASVEADAEVDAALPDVPYEGEVPDLPGGAEVHPDDSFPLPAGGVWRYRKKPDDIANLPPITEGGEVVVTAVDRDRWVDHLTEAEAEEMETRNERLFIRQSHLIVDGEAGKARRSITESLIVRDPTDTVGRRVKVKRMFVEENLLEPAEGQDPLVYSVDRSYLPAYVLVEDAWRVGLIATDLEDDSIRLTETLTEDGVTGEPRSGLITLVVKTEAGDGSPLAIEGAWRDGVHEIQVFDDFNNQQTRSYWVQKGVGPVQWQFRAARNTAFTLTESNLEAPAAAE